MIIYKVTNRINGKGYIGQTIYPLPTRWAQHQKSTSCCVALLRAIQKYGVEGFEIKTLLQAHSRDELNYYEEACIRAFATLSPKGYNLNTGGNSRQWSAATRQKRAATMQLPEVKERFRQAKLNCPPMTNETRQRLSRALKGRKFSADHRQNLSKAATGRVIPPVSDETRQRLSEAATKMWKTRSKVFKKHTPEAIEKIRQASTGRKHTDEAKAKISQTRLKKGFRHTQAVLDRISQSRKGQMTGENHPMYGKTHSDEAKQKISAAGKGRRHSEESRQKIAAASKKMWGSRSRTVPYKPRPSMKGRIPWNKGNTGSRSFEQNLVN